MAWLIRKIAASGRHALAGRLPAALVASGAIVNLIAPFTGTAFLFLSGYCIGGFLLVGVANMSILIVQPAIPVAIRALLTACGFMSISGLVLGSVRRWQRQSPNMRAADRTASGGASAGSRCSAS